MAKKKSLSDILSEFNKDNAPPGGWGEGKVYGLWYGGSSYAVGGFDKIEVFDDLESLKTELYDRWASSHGSFTYATEPGVTSYENTPVVEMSETDPETGDRWGTEMWVWTELPEDNGDLYPDSIARLVKLEFPGSADVVIEHA